MTNVVTQIPMWDGVLATDRVNTSPGSKPGNWFHVRWPLKAHFNFEALLMLDTNVKMVGKAYASHRETTPPLCLCPKSAKPLALAENLKAIHCCAATLSRDRLWHYKRGRISQPQGLGACQHNGPGITTDPRRCAMSTKNVHANSDTPGSNSSKIMPLSRTTRTPVRTT